MHGAGGAQADDVGHADLGAFHLTLARLVTQVQGDLNKVNIDPAKRAALFARYGQQDRSGG